MAGPGVASIGEQVETIGGVLVRFPCKPYPTQKAMMAKIIQALNHGQNALLESPTGSGKSLALLCSALAWQRQVYQKLDREPQIKVEESGSCCCTCPCHVKAEKVESPPSNLLAPPPSNQFVPLPTMGITVANSVPTLETNLPHTCASIQPPASANASSGVDSKPLLYLPDSRDDQSIHVETDCCKSKTNPVSVAVKPDTCGLEAIPPMQSDPKSAQNGQPRSSKIVENSKSSEPVSKEASNETAVMEINENGQLNDSLEVDFKPVKKRFRTPCTAGPSTKKKKKGRRRKGVVYEDPSGDSCSDTEDSQLCPNEKGHPTWRMEFRNPTAASTVLGVPQSQIMDTGIAGSSGMLETTATEGPTTSTYPSPPPCPKCDCGSHPRTKATRSPETRKSLGPKIFFGTRTHKQISQITREMGKTAYSDTPMCILASREHTCIHPVVSKGKNKNDECKKLLDYHDGLPCTFYHRVQQKLGSQAQLRKNSFTTAWDIEDLVQLGKRVRACPYYALRSLKEEADIVFCPYNYLIDPIIREQMLIEIRGQVVILDEAHNMEDSAKEAASLSVTSLQITDVVDEIEKIIEELQLMIMREPSLRILKESYQYLCAISRSIVQWMEDTAKTLPPRGFEQHCGIWNGEDFLPTLKGWGVTPFTMGLVWKHISNMMEATADEDIKKLYQNGRLPSISLASLYVLKGIFIVVGFLFKQEMKFIADYRITLVKTTAMRTKDTTEPGGWRRRRPRVSEKVWTYSLNFWCLNPAVAFSELTSALSIVLTSGTLSPMGSFSSELGVTFHRQLEANHVTPESQTWVCSLSHGPHGKVLCANYQNSETYEFQDELGEAVLRVCQTVPYGVLCFMSSYKMLEKLTKRWQDTGLWDRIMKIKYIVSEPRSGEKADFEAVMSTFYDIIQETPPHQMHSDAPATGMDASYTGALFLAVCRGKVSEGLDFADNNARAVITVGIPFPNIKDKQVELKREYNNEHCHSRGLLSGSEWYEIQAYRALNQALGRCIRHKKDWGALILVDERFGKGIRYTKGLSKWVRKRIHHQPNFEQAMSSLQSFAQDRMKHDADSSPEMASHSILVDKSTNPSFCTSPRATDQTLPVAASTDPLRSPLMNRSSNMSTCGQQPTSPSFSSIALVTSTPVAPGKSRRNLPASILPVVTSPGLPIPAHGVRIIPQSHATDQRCLNFPIQPHQSIPVSLAAVSIPTISSNNQTFEGASADAALSRKPLNLSLTLPVLQSSFQYPGGFQAPNPVGVSSISLSDITNLANQMLLKKEDAQTSVQSSRTEPLSMQHNVAGGSNQADDSETVSEDMKLHKVSSHTEVDTHGEEMCKDKEAERVLSPVSHTSSLPHCSESPLLFDSCESTSATPRTNMHSLASKLAEKLAHKPKALALPRQPSSTHLCKTNTHSERNTSVFECKQCPDRKPGCKKELDVSVQAGVLLHDHNYCSSVNGAGGEASKMEETCDFRIKDEDETPPLSPPEKMEVETNTIVHREQHSDVKCKGNQAQQTQETSTESKIEGRSLGLPKRNVRVAKRRSTNVEVRCSVNPACSVLPIMVEDDNETDFKTARSKTPSAVKQSKSVISDNVFLCSSCGKPLSRKPVSSERLDVKDVFSKDLACYNIRTIRASRLWSHVKGKKKLVQVYCVPAAEVNCTITEGTGDYNAVWDEKLGLCYCLLQCKTGHRVGVRIHSVNGQDGLESLIGKALLSIDTVNTS